MPRTTILVADTNATRRGDVAARCASLSGVAVLQAADAGEAARLIVLYKPQIVAVVSADMADVASVRLHDLAGAAGAKLVVLGARDPALPLPAVHVATAEQLVSLVRQITTPVATTTDTAAKPSLVATASGARHLICIGASTGGVAALETVLLQFPPDCPPTLIVQHIRPGFAEGLIRRLDHLVPPQVVAAKDGELVEHGKVYVAAAHDRHLGLALRAGLRLRLVTDEPVSGHRPSVDVLFHQAAAQASRIHISAAILTGMGADGAEGLAALRTAGAHTVAQDEKTSVVWGMPRVAIERGGAAEVLALPQIARALLRPETQGRP